MSPSPPQRPPADPADYDRAAGRLLDTIELGCDPGASFPEQIRAGLATTLELLSAEPELAQLLTVAPYRDPRLCVRAVEWAEAFAVPLRHAAARSPQALSHPRFLEKWLISGITCQLHSHFVAARHDDLDPLLSDLLAYVLIYYLDPAEVRRIATAPTSSPIE